MSEAEYDIMDQLYFVTSYEDIKELSEVDESVITSVLWMFINKGWVKCFAGPENEIEVAEEEFKTNFVNYHYLASKQGLLAHNMR
ncbi:MAG: hypothetical protein DRI71_07140 [Bacteroidetes bacterium]|nr:MAG: hypothetical protein DRI71_07140 [Bacteroidota bacterium]